MRIVVTGGSGFIGRHVVAELRQARYDVSTLHRGEPLSDVPHVRADVVSPEARAAVADADVVVHLAGRGDVQASYSDPVGTNHLNAVGTLNILEGARRRGAHVILASTQRVYRAVDGLLREDGPLVPADPYGVSKLIAEEWCRMYAEMLGAPTTVVRLFTVYGPGQVGQGTSGVVGIFLDRARRGLPLAIHSIQRRDLTEVGDVARGVRCVIEHPMAAARVYNLATGIGTSLEALARRVCALIGSSSEVVAPQMVSPEGDRIADISRARVDLGFEPSVSLDAGLCRAARWMGISVPEHVLKLE